MRGFGWILPDGLIAVGVTALAGVVAFGPIAEDVSGRTTERLGAEGRSWAKVATIDGRDVTLTGTAPDPEQRVLAVASADRVFGVRVVADETMVLPLASPYVFGFEKVGTTVKVTGAVPSDAARADLLARAAKALPGATIVDETVTARGAPSDWVARTDFALARVAQLKAGSFACTGDRCTIDGEPNDFATWEAIEQTLASALPPGMTIAADTLKTPAPPRWTFSAALAGGRLVLDGFLPDADARARVLAAAKSAFPAGVEDRTRLAPGARDGAVAAIDFTIASLAGLSEGGAKVDPAGYTILGKPKDWATYVALEKTLKAGVPGGLPLVADGLVAPVPVPYRLGLTAKGGTVTVEGFVPDSSAAERLLAALKANFATVEGVPTVAPGAPSDFLDTIVALVPSLSRFPDFGFDLADGSAKVTAAAPTAALGAQILAKIRGLLPKGYALAEGSAVTALPPPPQVDAATCQTVLENVQTREKILFDTGKASLREESIRVLDALVVASLECLSAHVLVEGHTDDEGEPDANMALSEARARAVVDYLVAGGIAPERLTATGFGEANPIAENTTAEGRQLNRRIEFRVE